MTEILKNDDTGMRTRLEAEPVGVGIIEARTGDFLFCDITAENGYGEPERSGHIINLRDPSVVITEELKPGMVAWWLETMVISRDGEEDEEILSDKYYLNPAEASDELPLG